MKINIYIYSFSVGGLQNTLVNLVNEIKGKYDIHIYTMNKTDKICENQTNMTNWPGQGSIFLKAISYIKFKLFKPRKADIHICWSTYCKLSCKKAFMQKGKSVVWVHSDLINSKRVKFVKRCKYKKFDNLVAVSNSAKNSMIKLGFKNCETIYNLIDDKFNNVDRTEIKWDFLNVARHYNEHKDVKRFIDIAKLNANKKFIQVGDGVDFKENTNYSKELRNIVFTGKRDPLNYYKESKVMLLTSKAEGFPIVILEALASGCDVYATPIVKDFSNQYWSQYIGVIDKENNLIKPKSEKEFNYNEYKKDVLKKIDCLFNRLHEQ